MQDLKKQGASFKSKQRLERDILKVIILSVHVAPEGAPHPQSASD